MLTIADIASAHDYRGLTKDLDALKEVVDKQKIGNGSTFLDMETGKVYIYDRENDEWREI